MANKFEIRDFSKNDEHYLLAMMMEFYMSPAVIHKPDVDLLKRDIRASLDSSVPLHCYIFTVDDNIIGYSMIVESFSTEYGLPCIWIEDLYIKERYRHRGIGQEYFRFLKEKYPLDKYRIRLEVAPDNENANRFYLNAGMEEVKYTQFAFPKKS